MEHPAATIAIPTYNRARQLYMTIACMVTQKCDFAYEILIINDGSTDETANVINRFTHEYKVPIRCVDGKGLGYTHALNKAVREFNTQWIAFCDDDQLTGPQWLSSLMAAAKRQNALMVGGPVLLDIPEDILNSLGPVCRDLFGESPDVREPERYSVTPPLPSGGNRLVHRKVFEKIGVFDDKMLTGGCDRDFLLRAMAADIPMGWAPEAKVRHRISTKRISYNHIKWYSLQWGCSFAYTDHKYRGIHFLAGACAARIAQALCINLPRMLYYRTINDKWKTLDLQALLWRAVGYTRKTLQILWPTLFSQEAFFSRVEFRNVSKKSRA